MFFEVKCFYNQAAIIIIVLKVWCDTGEAGGVLFSCEGGKETYDTCHNTKHNTEHIERHDACHNTKYKTEHIERHDACHNTKYKTEHIERHDTCHNIQHIERHDTCYRVHCSPDSVLIHLLCPV